MYGNAPINLETNHMFYYVITLTSLYAVKHLMIRKHLKLSTLVNPTKYRSWLLSEKISVIVITLALTHQVSLMSPT